MEFTASYRVTVPFIYIPFIVDIVHWSEMCDLKRTPQLETAGSSEFAWMNGARGENVCSEVELIF